MVDYKKSVIPSSTLSIKTSIAPSALVNTKGRNTNIGTVSFQERKVFFSKKERENHTHIIGSTGTGKSKLIEHLIRQDVIDRSCGLCLIDPHGSLYDELVLYISHTYPHLADRFILFNPAGEKENIVGFNPIPANFDSIDYTLDTLIGACLKAWGQDGSDKTPRITKWLENIFYTILVNNLTLVEAAPLIDISKDARGKREILLSQVNSDVVLGDWEMFESSTLTQKQTLIEGAANRLRKFLRNEIVRNIIGQQEKAIDFSKVMEEGKIVLVNLSSGGKISHDNSQLLGIMIVNEIFRCAKLRNPRDQRLKPFYLYIDEFGQFITKDIARALEECRKYRLFLLLAHQHLAQLKKDDEYLYASVMTNCKNKVVFGGLSKEDAEVMTDEIATGFLNLKTIKDRMFTTKVRHIEETRTVRSKSKAKSTGTNEGESESVSNSTSDTKGTGYTKGTGTSETIGKALTKGTSTSEGQTITHGTSTGYSDGYSDTTGTGEATTESESTGMSTAHSTTKTTGTSQGTSDSKTWGSSTTQSSSNTQGKSQGTSQSVTEGHSKSRGESSSTSTTEGNSDSFSNSTSKNNSISTYDGSNRAGYNQGDSESSSQSNSTSHNRSESFSNSRSETDSYSNTTGQNESHSQSHTKGTSYGESHSYSQGTNFSQNENSSEGITQGENQSRSTGKNFSRNQSHSKSHSDNFSESESRAKSTQFAKSESSTENTSRSTSTQESHSTNESRALTTGKSYGTSSSKSESQTTGDGESIVPFLRPEEYRELMSKTFFTKDEVHYLEMASIKNQGIGEAYIKISNNSPVKTTIDYVKSIAYNPRLSPKRIDDFRKKVFEKNSQYYTPLLEAKREYQDRQIQVFGEALKFDEKPLIGKTIIDVEPEVSTPQLENPFDE